MLAGLIVASLIAAGGVQGPGVAADAPALHGDGAALGGLAAGNGERQGAVLETGLDPAQVVLGRHAEGAEEAARSALQPVGGAALPPLVGAGRLHRQGLALGLDLHRAGLHAGQVEGQLQAALVFMDVDGGSEAGHAAALPLAAEGAVKTLGEFLDITERVESHHLEDLLELDCTGVFASPTVVTIVKPECSLVKFSAR